MLFLKRVIVGGAAFFLIFSGGAGTQSSNTLLQGMGFIGLILGLIALFVLGKIAWRAVGCLPSFLIISVVVLFILFAIGAFKDGVGGLGGRLSSFAGRKSTISEQETQAKASGALNLLAEEDFSGGIKEGFSESIGDNKAEAPAPASTQAAPAKKSLLGSIMDAVVGESKPSKKPIFDPTQLPSVTTAVKVVSGDTLVVDGSYFRLFGIDAPEMNQSCANAQGNSYKCGVYAANWLRDWLQDNPVECRLMQQDEGGNMVGICFLGDYDIGAALVNAGWAVAYRKYSPVYVPYEMQAQQNRRGLWQGTFYMPWDWRNLQTKKPKIKIIKPKKKKGGLLSS